MHIFELWKVLDISTSQFPQVYEVVGAKISIVSAQFAPIAITGKIAIWKKSIFVISEATGA